MSIITQENTNKRNYIWNACAGILNAGQSVVLLMAIKRIFGLETAGIFALSFSNANLFLNPGNFGVRNFQTTDIDENYSFQDYIWHRILITSSMFIIAFCYLLYTGHKYSYSYSKYLIFIILMLYKTVDCYEEVFDGRLQQRGCLYIANQVVIARLVISSSVIIICSLITKDIIISLTLGTIVAAAVSLIALNGRKGKIQYLHGPFCFPQVKGIFLSCFPLFLGYFMSLYLTNAPKYSIDHILDENSQAIYNFIAMPAFVINLLNTFMYQPILVDIRIALVRKEKKSFIRLVNRVMLFLGFISVMVLLLGYHLGIPLLTILYATNLEKYKYDFMIILLGSICLAISGFCFTMLTIIRQQKIIPAVYFISVFVALFLIDPLVAKYGIRGATEAYCIIMFVNAMIFLPMTIYLIYRELNK